jgi:TolB-like protein/Tfp pilus assembly protein PilF
MIDDPALAMSERDRRFLRYVVSETLAGRGERIKAYSIATEVFGRGRDFDAQNDPVVRVEAGRLRRALELYYLLAGRDDPVQIDMPKGGYKPIFRRRSEVRAPGATQRRGQLDISEQAEFQSPQDGSRLSIMVLPFANLTADPEQDYFAEALVTDLTTDLSRITGSFVISQNTAYTYKGKRIRAEDLGRELGVSFLIEGSVRREHQRVRVNVQLVDTRTGGEVWAQRFDGDADHLFALQDAITSKVAATLNAELVTIVSQHQNVVANPTAHDLVLRGRAAASRPRTKHTIEEAQNVFEEALRVDPQNNEAKIGLAEALVGKAISLFSVSREDDLRRADELASVALSAQPNSAWAHYVKGETLRCDRRTREAAMHYEAAISLNRNYAAAIADLGYSKMLLAQPAEGAVLLERALGMSPRDPLRAIWYSRIGQCDMYLERFETAKTALETSRSLNPSLTWNHLYLAGVYALLAALPEAQAALAHAQGLYPGLNSIKSYKALSQISNPELELLREKTLVAGLRLAGLPDVVPDFPDGGALGGVARNRRPGRPFKQTLRRHDLLS